VDALARAVRFETVIIVDKKFSRIAGEIQSLIEAENADIRDHCGLILDLPDIELVFHFLRIQVFGQRAFRREEHIPQVGPFLAPELPYIALPELVGFRSSFLGKTLHNLPGVEIDLEDVRDAHGSVGSRVRLLAAHGDDGARTGGVLAYPHSRHVVALKGGISLEPEPPHALFIKMRHATLTVHEIRKKIDPCASHGLAGALCNDTLSPCDVISPHRGMVAEHVEPGPCQQVGIDLVGTAVEVVQTPLEAGRAPGERRFHEKEGELSGGEGITEREAGS